MAVESTRIKRARQKPANNKPKKPYPTFPLTPHNSGAWQKKIRGQTYYFGRWARVVDGKLTRVDGDGWNEALELYKLQADDLHAGRTPRKTNGDGLTVMELCNRFLTAKQHQVDAGELTCRTFAEYRATTDRLVTTFGKNRLVVDLASHDFETLRAAVANVWGPVRLGNEVQRVRTVFKYGYEAGLIEKPLRYGPQFRKPSKQVMRKHRAQRGERMLDATQILTLLASASAQVKAMILLGVNCGFGNSDCANLTQSAVDLDGGWIRYPRPKTGVDRRCPLWPETVEVLKTAVSARPTPSDPEDSQLVFVTKYGNRWIRTRGPKRTPIDSVALEFGKLLRELEMDRPGVGFYALRHVFRTVADATRDLPAVRLIMGHSDGSIDDVYREHIADDRLNAVVEHVHSWLWPSNRIATNRFPS